MPEISNNILQLGAVAIIFLFAIREFFAWLKIRNGSNTADKLSGEGNDTSVLILQELQKMNSNHLHSLEEAIKNGNDRIVDAINAGNIKSLEILYRLEGMMDKK